MNRLLPSLSLFLIMTNLVPAGDALSEVHKVQVSVYSLQPNNPIYVTQAEGPPKQLKTFSGSVSDWVEVYIPLTLTGDPNSDLSTEWIPSNSTITKWFLILSRPPQESKPIAVTAIPGTNSDFPTATLTIVNTSNFEVSGKCNGEEFTLNAGSFANLASSNKTLVIDAKTSATPQLGCKISISDFNPDGRHLFVIGEPYIHGSAELKHRILRIPDSITHTSNNETNTF